MQRCHIASVCRLQALFIPRALTPDQLGKNDTSRKPKAGFDTENEIACGTGSSPVAVDERVNPVQPPKHPRRQNHCIHRFPVSIYLVHEVIHQRLDSVFRRRRMVAYSYSTWAKLTSVCVQARYRVVVKSLKNLR